MSNVVNTKIIILSTSQEFLLPGNWSAEQIKANYASDIQGITNMTSEESYEDNGTTRVLTFRPRTGNKG